MLCYVTYITQFPKQIQLFLQKQVIVLCILTLHIMTSTTIRTSCVF